jgi:hypothetical protein
MFFEGSLKRIEINELVVAKIERNGTGQIPFEDGSRELCEIAEQYIH